jgi:hypothetical protein
MLNLINGLSNYSQGYLRIETDPTTVKMARTYKFISPNDEIIEGTISEISRKYGLKTWVLDHLIRKTHKTSHGWQLL